MAASTSLFKKNGGMNYTRKSWSEYPGHGKGWSKNHKKSFGALQRPVCLECGSVIEWGEAYSYDGKEFKHQRCPDHRKAA